MREEAIRQDLFQAELVKLFASFNKPISNNNLSLKAGLLLETLSTLPTRYITPFFAYIRSTEDTLPSDGRMKRILSLNYDKFSDKKVEKVISRSEILPDSDWLRKFGDLASRVVDGDMKAEHAKKELGLS